MLDIGHVKDHHRLAYSMSLVIQNLPSVSGVYFLTEAHCKHRNVTAFLVTQMKMIPLGGKYGNGKYAMVDDEDFYKVSKHNWHLTRKGYAATNIRVNGKRCTLLMHYLIIETPPGMETDHKDLCGANNQKSNLRACTQSQNSCNQGLRKNNKTGVKGVCWNSSHRKFLAQMYRNGTQIHLGFYDTIEEASAVYQAAVKAHDGEFARW